LYARNGRLPYASINFVTAHDGFTQRDLVSYNKKHNEANGEDNRDGHNENLSWNYGVEGDTDDAAVLALRDRQVRNFLATLILSQGVPMLLAGDEIGRTQRGNNNAYCQDNEISWLDWNLDRSRRELLEFTRLLIRLFHRHRVLRRRDFFQGRKIRGSEVKDLAWFRPDGKEMTDDDWNNLESRCFGLRLAGDAIEEVDARKPLVDDTLLILSNARHSPYLVLPAHSANCRRGGSILKMVCRATTDAGGEHELEALSSCCLPRNGEAEGRKESSNVVGPVPAKIQAPSQVSLTKWVPITIRRLGVAASNAPFNRFLCGFRCHISVTLTPDFGLRRVFCLSRDLGITDLTPRRSFGPER
jgi:glycogen debranching enzyme GlgX